MKSSGNARSVILLTVVAAIAILAASWFLLISPTMTAAAEANTQAEQQEQTNENTQIEVDKLRVQYENLPAYEAQLAELQIQIPTTQEYADLQRMFSDVADKHEVVITRLEFGVATRLNQAGEEPVDDQTVTTEPAPSASPAPTAEPEQPEGAPTSALYSIPVVLEITGAYDDVLATLNELQTGAARIVLVTAVTLTPADTTVVDVGDTTAQFGGETFVLTSSTLEKEEGSDDGASPSPSPSPTN